MIMSFKRRLCVIVIFTAASAPADDRLVWDGTWATVTSSPAISLAFNNTAMCARDSDDVLHALWCADSSIWYGRRSTNAAWTISPLASGVGTNKPTLALMGTNLYAAWRAPGGGFNRRVVVTRSTDFGISWGSTVELSSVNSPDNISLSPFVHSNGLPGITVAWVLRPDGDVFTRTWRGSSWDVSDWTVTTQLCASGSASDVAVAAHDETILAVWEDARNGPHQLFCAESRDAGETWTPDRQLATNNVPMAVGDDPGVAMDTGGRAYVGFQFAGQSYLMRSLGSYTNYEMLGSLGPGLFVHAAVNTRGVAAMVWEYFTGALTNDALKRVGITVSSNNFLSLGRAVGPFAMPGSDANYARRQPTASLSSRWLDVFWIESAGTTQNLQHQSARLLSPLEGWRLDHFGSTEDGGDGADENDADGDGCANLLEYAAGSDPTNGLSSTHLSGGWYEDLGDNTEHLSVTYTAQANDSDLEYGIEGADSLSNDAVWLPCTNVVSIAGPDTNGLLAVTVSDFAPAATSTCRFMRLRISHP